MAAFVFRCLFSRTFRNVGGKKLDEFLSFPSYRLHPTSLFRKNEVISWVQQAHLRTNIRDYGLPLKQEELKDTREEDNAYTKDTIALVNEQLARGEEGRLFAVIHVAGKQFIVTQEDIIIIHGPWPPTISDEIKFEKVMLVGGSDFTLIGRPVLPPELVSINATVIDKDLSHVKTKFRFRKRKQFRRINFEIIQNFGLTRFGLTRLYSSNYVLCIILDFNTVQSSSVLFICDTVKKVDFSILSESYQESADNGSHQ